MNRHDFFEDWMIAEKIVDEAIKKARYKRKYELFEKKVILTDEQSRQMAINYLKNIGEL